jgi:Cu+-exporting ATPase
VYNEKRFRTSILVFRMSTEPRRPSLNVVQTGAIDPVCGMTVEPARAAGSVEHAGKTYYFCSQHCVKKFQVRPEYYTSGEQRREAMNPTANAESATATYTCPMDPEVVQIGPGTCPKCGMALEPMQPTAEEGPDPELISMQRRFVEAALLTMPVFLIAMGGLVPWPALVSFLHEHMAALNWLQLILATPVVLWCGWPFFQRAWMSVLNRSPNMFTLIALGVGAAFAFSIVATVAPQLFPASMRHGEAVEPYFDSAAVIIVLVLLGQVLELRARSQTGAAIRALLGMTPKTARVIEASGNEVDVPIEHVYVGDRLRIRPGEKVPVDGVVLEGRSNVDESLITGEPLPTEKTAGAALIGGTLNGTGGLVMQAQRVGDGTLLAGIVRMVTAAQRSRAPIEKLVNRVATYFVPTVLAIALLTFVGWNLWGSEPRLPHAILNSVAVLIIACPCALGLATPMAILVGTGRGATAGVLFRDAEALEVLHTADTLVLDKTGTLTEGKPQLVTVEPAAGILENELLAIADPIKATTREALAQLRAEGLRVIMLTGDSRATAEAVARQLDIDEVIAEVLPQEKGEVIARLQREGRRVAMAGDGVNDAPALAAANVGIAMGTGADVAVESAAVTLVQGDLRGIVRAFRLSRAITAGIRQNLFLAFIYNALSVPLAAIGLVNPMLASAAMSMSSVSVILNSLRLRKMKL